MAEASFQIDVDVDATSVEPAAVLLASLAQRLETTGTESIKAAQAVKEAEAAYKAAESAADRQAKALEKVSIAASQQAEKLRAAMEAGDARAIERASAKLEQLTQRQTEAAERAEAAKTKMHDAAEAVDQMQFAAEKAAEAEAELAKQMEATKKAAAAQAAVTKAAAAERAAAAKKAAAEEAAAAKKAAADQAAAAKAVEDAQKKAAGSGKLNEIAEGFGKLGGPLGQLGQKAFGTAEGVKKLFASLGDSKGMLALAGVGVAAITAAVIALGIALVAGIVKIGMWAVSLADAARSNKLAADAIMQDSVAGAGLNEVIGRLEDRVPIARAELMKMAADLKKAGLEGHALADALETAAEKAAKEKFGPEWQKQMLSLGSQAERLQRLFARLFGGLNIDRLLEKLATLVDLFDENNAAGQAIKVVFESLFQPLINGVTEWIPKLRSAFIQFEILVLKALIAIKPFGSEILLVAKIVGILVAVVVGVFAAALAIGVAIAVTFWTIVISLGESLWDGIQAVLAFGGAITGGLATAFDFISSKVSEAIDFLKGIDLGEIGKALIDGLIAGVLGGGPGLISSITGLAGGAIDAAKKALGIASPSKVFMDIGAQTTEGMVGGVEGGAPEVKSALEAMTSPPGVTPATSPATSSSGTSSPAPANASLAGAIFNFYGVKDAEHAKDLFLEAIESIAHQVAPTPEGAT